MKYVLVVDDDKVVNLLITRELQKNGYGVFMSYDTVQAGTTLTRTRVDAVTERDESRARLIDALSGSGLGVHEIGQRAVTSDLKPQVLCEPSQNGLFADCPQRQR